MKAGSEKGPIRRAIHHFIYSVCAISLGITPPPEDKELVFLGALAGGFLFIIVIVGLFAWFLHEVKF